MNLSRCEKGHFFDKEKYAVCPHCQGGAGSDDSLTTVFTEDMTTPSPVPVPQEPVNQWGQAPVMPADEVTLPTGGTPIEQPTIPYADDYNEQPTIPLTQDTFAATETVPTVNQPEWTEDDDHTVAFYDDIFSSPTTSKANTAPVKETVAKEPVKRSVSTPCTGWVIALDGNHLGEDFRLKVGKNFVGRDASMDIALVGDKSVSRNKHAILVYEPKQHLYLVQPGESSELVYLNDEVVLSPMKLQAYDVITVGEVKLLFMPLCGAKFNWTDYLTQNRQ